MPIKVNQSYLRGLGYTYRRLNHSTEEVEFNVDCLSLLVYRLTADHEAVQTDLLEIDDEYGVTVRALIWPCPGRDHCTAPGNGSGICRHGYDMEVDVRTSNPFPFSMSQSDTAIVYEKLHDLEARITDELPGVYEAVVSQDEAA